MPRNRARKRTASPASEGPAAKKPKPFTVEFADEKINKLEDRLSQTQEEMLRLKVQQGRIEAEQASAADKGKHANEKKKGLEEEAAAIEFISFGADVCIGIVHYYKKLAAYHEDIKDMIVESSKVMVKLQKSITDLQKKLGEITGSNISLGLSGKISSQMRRLLYPLRKSTIPRLQEVVEDSVEDIHDLMTKASHAAIVDDLEATTLLSEAVIAEHFFDATSRRTTSMMSLLASITYQICCGLGDDAAAIILAEIKDKRGRAHQQYEATAGDLYRAFGVAKAQATKCNRRIYIIVDGLNECDDIETLRIWLQVEVGRPAETAMWLLSNRKDSLLDQDSMLKHYTIPLVVGEAEVLSDLRLFIQHHLRVLSENISEEKKQELSEHLVRKSERLSVRCVDCFFDFLRDQQVYSNAEIDDALEMMPKGIFALYDRIMDRIKDVHPKKTQALLEWLIVAQRPLRLEEIADALAVETYSAVFELSPELCQGHVTECCALFIQEQAKLSMGSSDSLRGVIRGWESDISPESMEEHASDKTTFTYQAKVHLGFTRRDVFDEFPILSYIAQNWPVHVGECIKTDGFPLPLTRAPFYSVVDARRPESSPSDEYQKYKDTCVRYVSAYSIDIGKVPPLYAAVYFRWEAAVFWMLDNGLLYDGNRFDPIISSPLQLAVLRRFPNIVKALVDAGCRGNENIIRMLAKPLESSPEELYKAWSAPGAYLLAGEKGCVNKAAIEAVLSTLSLPFNAQWLQQVLQEKLWFTSSEDEMVDFLIEKAKELVEDGASIISFWGVAFAAKNVPLLERLLPRECDDIDTKSFNIALQESAVQLGRRMAPRDKFMAGTASILLFMSRRTAAIIQRDSLGVLAIHGYHQIILLPMRMALQKSSNPELTAELAAFSNRVQGTTLLHPGLIDFYYDKYPTISQLLFSAISRLPFRGELACYLADWLVLRHTAGDIKPPILVLDPPAIVLWQASPDWKALHGDKTEEPRPWGLGLVPHGPGDGRMEVTGPPGVLKIDDIEAPLWKFVRNVVHTHGGGADMTILPLFEERAWWPAGSGQLSDVWLFKLDEGGLIELRILQEATVAKRRNRDGMQLYKGVREGIIPIPDVETWRRERQGL
ncbi:hypothetical protein B0H63DRAFT_521372 [Podospora didyma]|uniref:Nephrocystin 3-like N-terminal domain-containing protein n=1 Tax=Podospora didyma TaxID=330526 RepID=A0AAE0NTN7_9PEZI|nr:hypothetical protein B0H63DRAFT_521372 [Podospora didyma]